MNHSGKNSGRLGTLERGLENAKVRPSHGQLPLSQNELEKREKGKRNSWVPPGFEKARYRKS